MTSGIHSTTYRNPLQPDPRLLPLLAKHGLDLETFWKAGRPSPGVREKRSSLVTELHAVGTPWETMAEITGMSVMTIQRLTKATWNEASRQNRVENAVRVGAAGAGKHKPQLSVRLRQAWSEGYFDFHRGRKRTTDELQRQQATFRKNDGSKKASRQHKALWATPSYREKLLKFHRSPEERFKRSKAQAERMEQKPYGKGRRCWVDPGQAYKCLGRPDGFWVRSTYELAAVQRINSEDRVASYQYEPVIRIQDTWIKPDFILTLKDGSRLLVEVKAAWATKLPEDHRTMRRLRVAEDYAKAHGMMFAVWTEKDALHDYLKSA